MPLAGSVPFTGSLLADGFTAAVVFSVGLYVAAKAESKAGWLPVAFAIYWGYLIFDKW